MHHLLVATAAGKPVFSLHGSSSGASSSAAAASSSADAAGEGNGAGGDSDAGSAGLAAAGVALGDYADGLSAAGGEEGDDDDDDDEQRRRRQQQRRPPPSRPRTPRNSLVSLTTPTGLRVLLARRGGLCLSVASRAGEPDAALLCYAEAAHASLLSLLTDGVHSALRAQPSFDAGRLLGGAGGVLGAVARGWGGFGLLAGAPADDAGGGGGGGGGGPGPSPSSRLPPPAFDACDLCAAFPPLPLPARLRAEATAALAGALAATGGVA